MPFLFTNAFLLAALAGLGIPVVIHLLLKRKTQRLRFSTIRFFARQEEQASSRRKLRNLLLLALRLLILALIVLAFARPYLPIGAASAGERQRRQVVLVLDRSLSLQATDSGGSRWARALQGTREFLSRLHPEDRVALVTCASPATVVSGFAPPSVIQQQVASQTPGHGAADLADGLREAERLIGLGDPKRLSSILVVGDLQRSGLGNLGTAPLPVGREVQVLPVGDLVAPNAAVIELNLDPGGEAAPHAVVANFGDEELPALRTELRVDGKPVLSRAIALKAGAATNLDLALPVLKPGWHDVEFRIFPGDSLAADDARFQTVLIPEPVRVLLVEGRPRARSFEEQTFFVAAALDPAFGTTNAGVSRFGLQKTGPDGLAVALAAGSGTARPSAVVLPAVKSVSGDARRALLEYVKAGGGLMLFVGDALSPNVFNADFSGLAPVALKTAETVGEESAWHLGDRDPASPLFAAFREPNSGNLSLPRFVGRFTVATTDKGAVSARFEDGVPLVVAGAVGQGRVLLVNTSADTTWSDWPKHKTFVPWMHHAVQYLAGRSDAAALRAGSVFAAGSAIELELGSSPAFTNRPFRLDGPGGQTMAVGSDSVGRIDVKASAPGVWSLKDGRGVELRRFSVHGAASESDLMAVRPDELQQQLVREAKSDAAGLAGALFGADQGRREFWRLLLMGALVLLLVETLFSNRSIA